MLWVLAIRGRDHPCSDRKGCYLSTLPPLLTHPHPYLTEGEAGPQGWRGKASATRMWLPPSPPPPIKGSPAPASLPERVSAGAWRSGASVPDTVWKKW